MARNKNLAAVPSPAENPEQPIKAEVLRAFYVEALELRSEHLELIEKEQELKRRDREHSERISSCFRHAKIDPRQWLVSFKEGTMIPKPPPAGPAEMAAAGPPPPEK